MSQAKIPRGALQFDPLTSIPYLSRPSPHSNIRIAPITGSSEVDTNVAVAMFNDPLVYPFLHGPPFPYTRADQMAFTEGAIKEYQELIFAESDGVDTQQGYAGVCPLNSLREFLPDGTDVWIGGISLIRYDFGEIADREERRTAVEKNEKKADGDPTIVWGFGGVLPAAH